MKVFFSRLFLFSLLVSAALAAHAQSCTSAVCNAASPNESDVLAALPSSSNSNATVTVNIPSGTGTWTTGFSYTVPSAVTNLTIQGNTTVTFSGTAGTSSYSPSVTDNTIIADDYASNNPLMVFNVGNSNSFVRFTGLTIQMSSSIPSGSGKANGWIEILSGSAEMRFDHLHLNTTTYGTNYNQATTIRSFAPLTEAVADHNVFTFVSGQYDFGISDFDDYGDTIGNGDGTWQAATPWGALTGIFYVESNYISGGGEINDCGSAGSMVIRYNTFSNVTAGIQTHGTKTPAGPSRGCRSLEAYYNYTSNTNGDLDAFIGNKGGTVLIWGNTMTTGYYRFFTPQADRNSGDENETNTPNGWGYCGTSINSNGVGSPWDGNTNTGTGYPCFDGDGRGQQVNTMNGANFPSRLNVTAGNIISWPHQYLEPIYLWMNTVSPTTGVEVDPRDATTINNEDYYFECGTYNSSCSSFTGTAGTGYGTLANRPSTCTAGPGGTYFTSPTGSYGVAYFATDANSGQGELYVCTSANTWTPIYQPYTYPHPLVSGSSTSTSSAQPPAPTGLAATAY